MEMPRLSALAAFQRLEVCTMLGATPPQCGKSVGI
jgi:hypothetical protein